MPGFKTEMMKDGVTVGVAVACAYARGDKGDES
jgi:hypothetical protein